MKSTVAFFLATAAAALFAVAIVQAHKSSSQQTQLASLKTELQAKAQQAEEAQAAQQRAEQQREAEASRADKATAQLRPAPPIAAKVSATGPARLISVAEPAKPVPEKSAMAKMMSQMMQDPASREFLKTQQRTMMDQLYTPLVKRMGLTPEEADQFKNMQTDHMMDMAGKTFSALGGGADKTATTGVNDVAAAQKSFDEQVKAFLGDDRYAQYQQFQETLSQRMQLNAYKLQAGNDYTLTEPQTEALLTIMKEEQKNAAAASGLPMGDTDKDPSKLQAMFADGKMDQLMQVQETVNQRVYDRARSVLSVEQLESFGRFETNQLAMMRASMGMMKGMFSGAGSTTPPDSTSRDTH
jgi:hypothetical protein